MILNQVEPEGIETTEAQPSPNGGSFSSFYSF